MRTDIDHHVNRVCLCLRQKKPREPQHHSLRRLHSNYYRWTLYIWTVVQEYILVIVDHFTRYTQAYPINQPIQPLKRSTMISSTALDTHLEFIMIRVQSSRTSFSGNWSSFLDFPMRTLPEIYKTNWKDHVNKLIHAYNRTRDETTGYSPFLLLLSLN